MCLGGLSPGDLADSLSLLAFQDSAISSHSLIPQSPVSLTTPSRLSIPPANLRLRRDRLSIGFPPKLLLAKQRSQFNGRSRSIQGIGNGSCGTRFIDL